MDIRGFLRALRKNWWIVLTAVVLALGVGMLVTARTPAQYQSTVTFFVNTSDGSIDSPIQGDQYGQRRVNSYVQLLGSQRLAELIAADLGDDLSFEQIMRAITAKADTDTVMLTAIVTDTSAVRSLAIAKSLATKFTQLVGQLETPMGASSPTVRLEVTTGPILNPVPVAPRPLFIMGLSLVAGLLLGVCAAVLRDVLDSSVRGIDTLGAVSNAASLGVIAFDPTAKRAPLIVDAAARSIRAEAFRQLRTNIQFLDVDNPVRVVVVSSSIADEGKSSTATNLAVSFAEAGEKVLLIEGDLRRPRVADYLNLARDVGLTNVLAGRAELDDVLQTWGSGGLTVLVSGAIPPNPSELLGSHQMGELLLRLKKTFEIIIIDTPPLLPVTDAAVVAAHADGAILVVRYGRTSRNQVATAAGALRAVDARLLGTVLNMVPTRGVDAYQYGYGYYEEESGKHSKARSGADVEDTSTTAERVPVRPFGGRAAL